MGSLSRFLAADPVLIPLWKLVRNHGVEPGPTLHIGAHLGEEAQAYHKAGFKPVTWIEGNPDLIEDLSYNVSRYKQNVIPALVSDSKKDLVLHIASNGQSSSYLPLGTHSEEHPEVTYVGDVPMVSTTVDDLFAEGKIDRASFLNIDTQGTELDVLRGAEKYLAGVQAVYTEVNADYLYVGCALFDEITPWLKERGFRLAAHEWTRFAWGDACYVR